MKYKKLKLLYLNAFILLLLLSYSCSSDGDMVRESYTGGNENTSVVLYTDYEEQGKGGHVWFNGAIDGKSPNQILWDFLSSYSLND